MNEQGSFYSADELRSRFGQLGVTNTDEVIVYCGSGVTACHDLLAMERAGLPGRPLPRVVVGLVGRSNPPRGPRRSCTRGRLTLRPPAINRQGPRVSPISGAQPGFGAEMGRPFDPDRLVDDALRAETLGFDDSTETIARVRSVVSVNVGAPRTVDWRGRRVTSAIWKDPVEGPVTIEGVNLTGDDQADRRVHGGPDKAVYAYSVEDYDWWAANTGPLTAGTFGENLTTLGIDLTACYIGDRWHVGSAVLEVSQPREPCFKLGLRMGDDHFPGKFAAAGRPGVYLRISLMASSHRGHD